MCWSSQVDINIISPLEIDETKVNDITNSLKEFSEQNIPVRGNYIDICDRSKIQLNFSCSYKEFIVIICYLSKMDKIRIKDYEGSCLLFEFN
ncbi:MAG: hypothetical protein ACFFDF_14880 [Candidatus Odinarchaeota archaeon]